MTAIAAVIALASAPSFAQDMVAPDLTTPAPVVATVPAPVAAEPPAPAPVADAPAVADPLAAEAVAKPAAPRAKTAKSTVARSRPAPARAAAAAPAQAIEPAAAPIAETPAAELLPIQPEAVPVQAPVAEPPPPAETTSINPMVPIAGLGALVALGLIGTGLVLRRRRRRVEDADDAARREFVGTTSDADAEPAMIGRARAGGRARGNRASRRRRIGARLDPGRLHRRPAGQPCRGGVRRADGRQSLAVNQEAGEARPILRPARVPGRGGRGGSGGDSMRDFRTH